MQRNSLNRIFKILSDQEQMILSSHMYEKTYLQVSLKELLKLLECLASISIHTISGWLDLFFKALDQERKRRMKRIPTRLAWAPLVVVVLGGVRPPSPPRHDTTAPEEPTPVHV